MKTRTGGYQSPSDGITFHIRPPPAKRPRRSQALPRAIESLLSPLLDLPDDIIVLILGKLAQTATSAADIVNGMMTCRRLCSLSTSEAVLSRTSPRALALKADCWSDGAHRFLRKCAQAGSREAAFRLGMAKFYCLEDRRGGATLMARAAMAGHADALYCLAVIHFNGSGGTRSHRDLASGVILCAKAGAQGHVDALRELGHCLQDGYGLPRNAPEGRRLLLEANAREAAQLAARQAHNCRARRQSGATETSTGAVPVSENSVPARPTYIRSVSGPLLVPSLLTSGGNSGTDEDVEEEVQDWTGRAEEEGAGEGDEVMRDSAPTEDGEVKEAEANVPAQEESGIGNWLKGDDFQTAVPGNILDEAMVDSPQQEEEQRRLDVTAVAVESSTDHPTTSPPFENPSTSHDSTEDKCHQKSTEAPSCTSCDKNHPTSVASSSSALSWQAPSVHEFLVGWHATRCPPCSEGLRVCSSEACGRPETRRQEFRCCSACGVAKYCSRACQARDWRAGHRTTCTRAGVQPH